MFIFLLSGLFCCLGFSVVIFFAVWAGAPFFLLFGRGPRPRPNSKKKTPPAQTAKKTRTRPFRAFFFCCFAVWAGGCVYFFAVWARGVFFFAVWAGVVFFFLLFGRGRVLFFAVWAVVFFFAVLGGGVFFFCCLGRGRGFFLLFGRGTGVHSLTRLPGSSLSDPTTKETEQQKKKHGFPVSTLFSIILT